MTQVSSIHLFYPLIFGLLLVIVICVFSLIRKKLDNTSHSETKQILKVIHTETLTHSKDTQDNIIKLAEHGSDNLKQVAFTKAHEAELHDLEQRIKKLEELILK